MNYVGFCVDMSTGPFSAGPGDVMGYLIAGDDIDGWRGVTTHLCSSEWFADKDIRYHFRQTSQYSTDLYVWEGLSTMDAMAAKYPPSHPAVAEGTETP